MGRAIQRWVAEDGTEFDDERSMVLYELSILDASEIEIFLKDVIEASPRKTIEYRKILKRWQAYLQKQQYPVSNDDVNAKVDNVSTKVDNPDDLGTQIDAKIDAELEQMLQPTEEETDDSLAYWPDGMEVATLRVNG